MSVAIERVHNIVESVNTLTELKRLSICIDIIGFMSNSSLLGRFERKVGEVLDNRDRTKSLDHRDVNDLIKVNTNENKRAMALYTCVDKGNEKLAYDLNYLNISLQMVSEVI